MNDDLFQGRNPEKVERDYEATVKFMRWALLSATTVAILAHAFGVL